jgi:hypothetical protein
MAKPTKFQANADATLLHAQPIRALFESISEVTCTDLALGIDALSVVIGIADDDCGSVQPQLLRDFHSILLLIRRQLQESKNQLESLSNVAQLVSK